MTTRTVKINKNSLSQFRDEKQFALKMRAYCRQVYRN